ncbi:MAG: hypothetical protein DRJ01_02200 [Bacteroidetes bacterium]|nr:MAG: hypothetical protein DRJ01_02200 [Bacteroidota bacterium]
MAYPRFGNYQAVVTDNSEFWKRGYIRVRISAFFSGDIDWDLSQPYDDAEFKSALKDDIRCLVYTPIGGGSGHGMFTLPQVNSVGIVSFIDGNIKKALWMGSFIASKYDKDGKFESANVPNDRLQYEGPGSNGITVDGKNVLVDGGAVIIRQKSTESGSAEGMKWDNNRTENLIVMGKNTLNLTHASKWEESEDTIKPIEYQEIAIKRNTDENDENFGVVTINIKSIFQNDDATLDEYGVEITKGQVGVIVKSQEAKIENSVIINTESISMKSLDVNSKAETSANISPEEITLVNRDANVTVSKDEVNIFGKKHVTLSGDETRIGGLGQEYVVTASVPFSYRMEDGTVLAATNKVKA